VSSSWLQSKKLICDFWTCFSGGILEIYAPLERKQASKAVVAQIFSQILTDSKIDVAEILKDPHLKYLVDAIKYVTNV